MAQVVNPAACQQVACSADLALQVGLRHAEAVMQLVLVSKCIHESCAGGDIQAVQSYIKSKGDVNHVQAGGMLPLHQAAAFGHTEVVHELLLAGAFLDAPGPLGATPLHLACRNGHLEVARALLEQGASMQVRCAFAYTPLHWAVEVGNTAVARELLERGADLGGPQSAGSSLLGYCNPLYLACRRGRVDMVKLLLHFGADPAAHTSQGPAPEDVVNPSSPDYWAILHLLDWYCLADVRVAGALVALRGAPPAPDPPTRGGSAGPQGWWGSQPPRAPYMWQCHSRPSPTNAHHRRVGHILRVARRTITSAEPHGLWDGSGGRRPPSLHALAWRALHSSLVPHEACHLLHRSQEACCSEAAELALTMIRLMPRECLLGGNPSLGGVLCLSSEDLSLVLTDQLISQHPHAPSVLPRALHLWLASHAHSQAEAVSQLAQLPALQIWLHPPAGSAKCRHVRWRCWDSSGDLAKRHPAQSCQGLSSLQHHRDCTGCSQPRCATPVRPVPAPGGLLQAPPAREDSAVAAKSPPSRNIGGPSGGSSAGRQTRTASCGQLSLPALTMSILPGNVHDATAARDIRDGGMQLCLEVITPTKYQLAVNRPQSCVLPARSPFF